MRADARRNYEALLAAARELFLEQGPDAPLDEVAKRAGVGAGTLYRHFPSRNDLVAAVYVADIEAMCDSAEKQDAGVARKDLDSTTLLRMLHGIALACEETPELAPSMLQVMKAGVLVAQ